MAWTQAAREAAAAARRRNKSTVGGILGSRFDKKTGSRVSVKRVSAARKLALQNKWMDRYQANMRAAEKLGRAKK